MKKMSCLMVILEEISNFIYSDIINQLPKIKKIFMTNIIINIEQKLANFCILLTLFVLKSDV